ncbi:MAG TPA: hypothetical protein VMJ10_03375 [Kofleriaceae bacterium]|nr:hypothetical protein [Kofleriaceae bacterium]
MRLRALVLVAALGCNKPKTHGPYLDDQLIAKIEYFAPECNRPLGPKAVDGVACSGDGVRVNLRTEDERVVIFRMAVDAPDAAQAFRRAKPLLRALVFDSDALEVCEKHLGDVEIAAHWASGHIRVETGQLVPGSAHVLPIWQVELDW